MPPSIANLIKANPRGRSESQWLDCLNDLVSELAKVTEGSIQIGRYWIEDFPDFISASATARVCCHNSYPGASSDYWEAAVCLSVRSDRGWWADAYVLPYLQGSRVTRFGRMPDDGSASEEQDLHPISRTSIGPSRTPARLQGDDDVCQLGFFENQFIDQGWVTGDGPGEWAWVRKPGDEFPRKADCRVCDTPIRIGQPIWFEVTIPNSATTTHCSQQRISLFDVTRDLECPNLHPCNTAPAPASPHISVADLKPTGEANIGRFDLRQFGIAGG